MSRLSTDILVSGGGIAGLTAAAAFGAAGFSVICVDPDPPVTAETDPGADLRSTAFLQPSIPVLQAAGVWDRLLPFAAPLQIMRIIDAGGETARAADHQGFQRRRHLGPALWLEPTQLAVAARDYGAADRDAQCQLSSRHRYDGAVHPRAAGAGDACQTATRSTPGWWLPPMAAIRPCAKRWELR